jgi:hypothetical protein
MSEISEPSNGGTVKSDTAVLKRIQVLMVVLLAGGVIGSLIWFDWRVTVGLALGGALGFVNFYWLRASLGKMLGAAAAGAQEPVGLWLIRHNLRFLFLIIVIFAVAALGIVSLPAVFAGILSLAGAIVIEGFVQLFLAVFRREEV